MSTVSYSPDGKSLRAVTLPLVPILIVGQDDPSEELNEAKFDAVIVVRAGTYTNRVLVLWRDTYAYYKMPGSLDWKPMRSTG